ncbi:MAG: UPF0280 family protein [Alphaproteobacteria bacterium]
MTPSGGAYRGLLGDGERRHFQHGPIDLVLEAFGAQTQVALAHEQAWIRFADLLPELVAELSLLRRALGAAQPPLAGAVARRMLAACWPHRRTFVTPMAAVAGAVADEILAALVSGRDLRRAYVNNGGDIALFLAPGESFDAGVVCRVEDADIDGVATIGAESGVRGIATSGWNGRSHSLGIADAVTVLAGSAAEADVAATLIANAVDADHPAIARAPAAELDPDSDLGDRLVTVAVGELDGKTIEQALGRGARVAAALYRAGRVAGALLALAGRYRVVGEAPMLPAPMLPVAVRVALGAPPGGPQPRV